MKKLNHENSYHNKVMSLLINNLGVKEAAVEVKLCKTKTFNPNCIRLNQKALLANPGTIYFHPSDSAMDFGGSRGVDGFIATAKYLCIVHMVNDKPQVIPIFMNHYSLCVLTESTKLDDLIGEYGSYGL
jgi:hypothetical protein